MKSVGSNPTGPERGFGGMVYAIDLKSIFFLKCLVLCESGVNGNIELQPLRDWAVSAMF